MVLLIKSGANVNAKNKEGWTPLHIAIKKASLSAIAFLLDLPNTDLNIAGGPEY